MTHLKLLQGSDIARVFQRADVVVFRYQLNPPGVVMGAVLSVVGLGLAGVCWWETGLAKTHWMVAFSLLILGVVGLLAVIGYWIYVARNRVVIVAPEGLFLGGRTKMWAVSWALLDRRSLGLEDLELKKLSAALRIVVAGQTLPLHLYNMIAYLRDIEGLMFHLLQALEILDESALGMGDEASDLGEGATVP